MAFTNFETKEIHAKVLYMGPSGCGKTANLRSLLAQSSPELQAGLFHLADAPGPTPYFDFLPMSVGLVHGFHLKVHIFTLPKRALYETSTKLILHGIDGFVFVADSRVESLPENIDSYQHARRLLMDHGYTLADMPRVIQYNKRDLPYALSNQVLRQELNPTGVPEFDAIATQDHGTMETFRSIASQIIKKLEKAETP